MNIEKIAVKLRPLMDRKISNLLKARNLAGPDLKALMEKQIVSLAYATFGEFQNKILLSLPSKKQSKGPLNLGTILYEKEKWEFGISPAELLQNLGIFGRSGSGKTNLAFHIIRQLDKAKIPFLFFDHKRTLRHLLPHLKRKVTIYTPGRSLSPLSFNPFITPPGLESRVYLNQVIDVLASAFTLGEGAKSILQKALFACYQQDLLAPTLTDIIEEVDKLPAKERVRGWKLSAIRALESMDFSQIAATSSSQQKLVRDLIKGNTVVELDGLSGSARKFLIPVLYQWLFQCQMNSSIREKLSIVVFIDEAHLVFTQQQGRSQETLMESLLRQTREIGIATIILDQTPNMMSKVVLANCYTNIFLNLVGASDLGKAATVCLLDAEEKKYFSRLPVGQGIIKLQDRWTSPFLLKFPLVQFQKGSVTDAVLSRYFDEISTSSTHSPCKTSLRGYFDVFRRIPPGVTLTEPALRLLHDIVVYPFSGVRERYRRLDVGDKKGHRIKADLLAQGWIESQLVEQDRTRTLLLRLTKTAKEHLGLKTKSVGYGSLVHEYWKHYWARWYRDRGHQVNLEVPRKSGRVDVAARKKNRKIAIEIETGKSDFLRNVRQDLAAKYDKIVVVATDKSAYEKIEKQLIGAGLLMKDRVEIVLQTGQF